MNKYYLIIIFIILFASGAIIAEDFDKGVKLNQGENIINFSSDFNPIYVKDLINIYPEIATITYNNGYQEAGYVNVFGGIGENFVISPNQVYEIVTTEEVILNLG